MNAKNLVVVFHRRARKLRGVEERHFVEIEAEHSVQGASIGGCQRLGAAAAGQSEQNPEPAGARDLADDAEENSQIVTDDERSSAGRCRPTVVVDRAGFVQSAPTMQ